MSEFNCRDKIRFNHHPVGVVKGYVVKVEYVSIVCGDPFSDFGLEEGTINNTYYDIICLVNGKTFKKHSVPEVWLTGDWDEEV